MTKLKLFTTAGLLLLVSVLFAQEETAKERAPGHLNQSKFKQMYEDFATPNMYRSASGTPGPSYYQQQADYKIPRILSWMIKMPVFMGKKPSPITTMLQRHWNFYGCN